MRSVSLGSRDDLTARARILHAAICRFATDGLGAPLRVIAADAGVSPGLIMHHFGSRTGLLEACDNHVREVSMASKTALMGQGAAVLLTQLAQREQYAPAVGYVLRRLQAGGPTAAELIDSFVEDTVQYLAEGERNGVITPSRGPQARARLLTTMGLGALLLELPAPGESLDVHDLPRWMREYTDRIVGPSLELYTQPLLADSSMLDAYLAQEHADDARPTDDQNHGNQESQES